MKEEYSTILRKLGTKYSSKIYGEYKDGGLYGNLLTYSINNDKLSVYLHPDGKPEDHIELIQSVIKELIEVLPKGLLYTISISGWFTEIKNGDLDINFKDGNYYIKSEHQLMHENKEVATIADVIELNKLSNPEIKWSVVKKKSIELGFIPVKDKSGFENLYLIEAFKICYPEYSYDFKIAKDLHVEPKKKKFLGLF
jgi:hypothetical protein